MRVRFNLDVKIMTGVSSSQLIVERHIKRGFSFLYWRELHRSLLKSSSVPPSCSPFFYSVITAAVWVTQASLSICCVCSHLYRCLSRLYQPDVCQDELCVTLRRSSCSYFYPLALFLLLNLCIFLYLWCFFFITVRWIWRFDYLFCIDRNKGGSEKRRGLTGNF